MWSSRTTYVRKANGNLWALAQRFLPLLTSTLGAAVWVPRGPHLSTRVHTWPEVAEKWAQMIGKQAISPKIIPGLKTLSNFFTKEIVWISPKSGLKAHKMGLWVHKFGPNHRKLSHKDQNYSEIIFVMAHKNLNLQRKTSHNAQNYSENNFVISHKIWDLQRKRVDKDPNYSEAQKWA